MILLCSDFASAALICDRDTLLNIKNEMERYCDSYSKNFSSSSGVFLTWVRATVHNPQDSHP